MSSWLFLLCFIGLFLAVLGIVYGIRRHEIGHTAAARDLLRGLVVIGVMIIVFFGLFRLLPVSWGDRAWVTVQFSLSVVFWAHIVTWPRRKRQAGAVLLDLGRSSMHKFYLVVGCFVLIGIGSVRDALSEAGGEIGIDAISLSLFHLSVVALLLFSGLSGWKVRERGILHFDCLVKWKHIESYAWGGNGGHTTLALRIRRRLPFFGTLRLRVPSTHKDALDSLLAEHVPSATTEAGNGT